MSSVLMCTAHGGAFYTAQGRAPHATPCFYPCPRRGPRAYPHAPRTAPMLVRMQGSRPSSAPAARIAPRAPPPFLWVGCAPGLAPTERGPETDSAFRATLTTKAVVHSDDTFVEVVVLSLPFLSTALHLSQGGSPAIGHRSGQTAYLFSFFFH